MRTTLFVLASALLCSACVSTGTYDQKVQEAALLGGTLQTLEQEYASLAQQKEQLAGEKLKLGQDLASSQQNVVELQQDLERTRADVDRLERVLSTRSEETGKALTELRQTVDRLEADNRTLTQQNQLLTEEANREKQLREASVVEMKSTYDELVSKMESEIQRGEITISELQGRLTVNMVERILFDSGKADVKPAGLEVLKRVGDILKQSADKEIRVEGHTDNVPISPRLQNIFPSNWELSTARANNVVHFLQEKVGIPGERLSASGLGEFRPVADNATSEGRAQNRRIQIVLVPLEAPAAAQP